MSHNNLYSMESPRRDHMNNAALKEASNSKIVNYVSFYILSVFLVVLLRSILVIGPEVRVSRLLCV